MSLVVVVIIDLMYYESTPTVVALMQLVTTDVTVDLM
jgi:hypothetical protein